MRKFLNKNKDKKIKTANIKQNQKSKIGVVPLESSLMNIKTS